MANVARILIVVAGTGRMVCIRHVSAACSNSGERKVNCLTVCAGGDTGDK